MSDVDWNKVASDWGDIVGSLVQTAVVAIGGAVSYISYLRSRRARLGDFHVILRRIDKVTSSDHPIDGPGYWVVFSNGTGLPVSWWRIYLRDTSEDGRAYSLSSREFGPILPTSSTPMARQVVVSGLDDGARLEVTAWTFRSGNRYWRADNRGFDEIPSSESEAS